MTHQKELLDVNSTVLLSQRMTEEVVRIAKANGHPKSAQIRVWIMKGIKESRRKAK